MRCFQRLVNLCLNFRASKVPETRVFDILISFQPVHSLFVKIFFQDRNDFLFQPSETLKLSLFGCSARDNPAWNRISRGCREYLKIVMAVNAQWNFLRVNQNKREIEMDEERKRKLTRLIKKKKVKISSRRIFLRYQFPQVKFLLLTWRFAIRFPRNIKVRYFSS